MGIYKRKGIWYVDIYYEGRRIRRVGGSKKDAENVLAAIKADILRGKYKFKKEKKILFEKFADEYLNYQKINRPSWKRSQSSINKLRSFLKGKLLSNITVKRIEEFKEIRREQGIKPVTINRDLLCLNHMFNVARKLGYFNGENPVKEVKYFKERPRDMRILSEEEISQLIKVTDGYLRSIIIVALNAGMRKGEVFNLRWGDIDFVDNFIYVRQTKSGYMRKIPMNDVVRKTIKDTKRDGEFIFCSPKTGSKLTNITKSFDNARNRIGMPELHFHDLRHSCATHLIQKGIDLVTVKEILGHADIKMTVKYAHPTPENKRKAVDVLATIFSQKSEEMDKALSYREDKFENREKLVSIFKNN